VFALDELFGSLTAAEAGIIRFRYRQITPSFAGVDDPGSRHYNRIVDAAGVAKDWNSAENMMPTNGVYSLGCVVRHNWRPFSGYGSCIFLHTWQADAVPTSGCTAMARNHLEQVLRWLDQAKSPLLVQLPIAEYEARKAVWHLP
jgi:D-alanyl-D-alanine dipeptidase